MTYEEKKKKAISIAVACFIEEEKAAALKEAQKPQNAWARMGRETIAENRIVAQRRGRVMRFRG